MAPTPFSSPSTQSLQAAAPEKRSEGAKSDARFAALPGRAPLGELRGALFAAPAPQPTKPVAAPPPPAQPSAPPMPYRVAGRVMHDGITKVVLAKGDLVLPVEAGETLEGGYRVDAIGADEITLVYLPLGIRERLPVAATLGGEAPASAPAAAGGSPRPAQLRWEGPERVQAGNAFNVTLKVTSDEPLRASPLQLSFDPQLLEAVAVRPGKFFGADSSFSYRVNPQGSIVVGASGQGSVAADAELVILTFKPIRPAASTEVKISSLVLQGAVGKSIAVEPLGAYRTSIVP
jgi:hypothetical protein